MAALHLLQNRNFMLVWTSGWISWTGNYALFVALPVYVYGETASALATSLSVMATALPTIVVGQVAGVLVDRWPHKWTMVLTNFALAGVTLIFLSVINAPWWAVVPVAFVQASVGQFLGPAENALLPTLVAKSSLGAANSLNALNNNLARLVGPAVGGLLIGSAGFAGVVVLDALTYLAAAGLVLGVEAPSVEAPSVNALSADGGDLEPRAPINPYRRLVHEWLSGLRAVSKHPPLRLSVLTALLVGFGEGFVSVLMAPFVEVMLGGGGPELGYLFSAQAVGGVLAGFLLTHVADRIPALALLRWSSFGTGLVLLLLFGYPLLYPEFWPGLVFATLLGLPAAGWGTAQMTLVQTEAEPDVRGRVFSAYFATFSAAQLVGMGVSGVLGERVSVLMIGVDALMYVFAGIVLALAERRYRQRRS